jgi:hypothetical protein
MRPDRPAGGSASGWRVLHRLRRGYSVSDQRSAAALRVLPYRLERGDSHQRWRHRATRLVKPRPVEDVRIGEGPAGVLPAGPWRVCWPFGGQSAVISAAARSGDLSVRSAAPVSVDRCRVAASRRCGGARRAGARAGRRRGCRGSPLPRQGRGTTGRARGIARRRRPAGRCRGSAWR